MAIKIRLARHGAKKRPHYAIVVADVRAPRDGKYIEKLGRYNPMVAADHPDRLVLVEDRIQYWLSQGAQTTDRVERFLSIKGISSPYQQTAQTKKSNPKAKAQERLKVEADAIAKREADAQAEIQAKKDQEEADKLAQQQAKEAAIAQAQQEALDKEQEKAQEKVLADDANNDAPSQSDDTQAGNQDDTSQVDANQHEANPGEMNPSEDNAGETTPGKTN